MSTEPGLPVLIGAGTAQQRFAEPGEGRDCTGLVVDAVHAALVDVGAAGAGERVGWIGATRGLSTLPDVARRVSDAIGVQAFTVATDPGIPQQTLINCAFEAVRSGVAEVAIVCGGETKHRDDTVRRAGLELPGHDQAGLVPDLEMSPEGEIVARPEVDIGMVVPAQQYAVIENARRVANGWTIDEHRDDIAAVWQRFNAVAARNPRADFGAPMGTADIRDPGPTNRGIAWPYNKWHNSQWSVDQAAALVFCSDSVADRLGIAPERRVYPHVGLESSLSLSLSRRADLHRWPAMHVLGQAAADHIGRPIASMDHMELYSCFPVAVRVQQSELGLDPDGTPTLTGGMAFAGGPFNSFVFQATVAMTEQLRRSPDSYGAVTAVSGLLTKPALAVWSTDRPANGLLVADLVDEARAATAEALLDEDPDGPGFVAGYTVTYEDAVPSRVCAIVDLDTGYRAVAALDDPAAAVAATIEDLIGTRVRVSGRVLTI